MSRGIWAVRIDAEDTLHLFEEEAFARAYAGACGVAEIPVTIALLPVDDRAETAERIRETIAHLDGKGGA